MSSFALPRQDARWPSSNAIAAGVVISIWLLWGLLPVFTTTAAPEDNIEQLVWAQSFEWGYAKHPPFPTWLLQGLGWVFGPSLPLTFLLASACNAVALCLVWRASTRWFADHESLAALCIGSCVFWFTGRASVYNHNTVLLVGITSTMLLLIRAIESRRLSTWALAGAAFGVAMLTKYQALIFVPGFVYLLWPIRADRQVWRGFVVATLVAALVFAPHVIWVLTADQHAIGYAMSSIESHFGWVGRLKSTAVFLLQQVWRVLPAVLVGWLALPRRLLGGVARSNASNGLPGLKRLLIGVILLPLAVIMSFGIVQGTHLQSHWAVITLPYFGVAVVGWRLSRQGMLDLRKLFIATFAVHALTAGWIVAQMSSARSIGRDHRTFEIAPATRLARDAWANVSPKPIPLVIGPQWEAGLLAHELAPIPRVAVSEQGDRLRSPWIDACQARVSGGVVLWDPQSAASGNPAAPWLDAPRSVGEVQLNGERLAVGVVPPNGSAVCSPR